MENIKLDRFIELGYTIRMSIDAYADGDLDLTNTRTTKDISDMDMPYIEYEVNYDDGHKRFTIYDKMDNEIAYFNSQGASEQDLLVFLEEFVKELENNVDNTNIKMAKILNARYGLLEYSSYELPDQLYDLAFSVELPSEEFENTEFEDEIYEHLFDIYVTDILNQFDGLIFNWFLPVEDTKITLSFISVGENEENAQFTIDTKLDSQSEVDRVIKSLKKIYND